MKNIKTLSAIGRFLTKLESKVEQRLALSDEEIERELARLKKADESLFARMMDHPVGFCVLFFGGCFMALGLAELLCTLLGFPFDPRLG